MNFECKKLNRNVCNPLPVQSAKESQLNTVAKDVFNRIGLRYISLNVLDSSQKPETLFCLPMSRELRGQLLLLNSPTILIV